MRQAIEAEVVHHELLRQVAGIGQTSTYRYADGTSPVPTSALRAWFESSRIPAPFRNQCGAELAIRREEVLPSNHRDPLDDISLDANNDTLVNEADARIFETRHLVAAAKRHEQLEVMLADGVITDDEEAAQERLAAEEELQSNLLRRTVHRLRAIGNTAAAWLSPRTNVARRAALLAPLLFAAMC